MIIIGIIYPEMLLVIIMLIISLVLFFYLGHKLTNIQERLDDNKNDEEEKKIIDIKSSRKKYNPASFFGFIIGGFVGYTVSPKNIITYDISIIEIITRGIIYDGSINRYEFEAIHNVFNYMLAGALICAFIGYIATRNK